MKLACSLRVFIKQQGTQSTRPSLPCRIIRLACFSAKPKWEERVNSVKMKHNILYSVNLALGEDVGGEVTSA